MNNPIGLVDPSGLQQSGSGNSGTPGAGAAPGGGSPGSGGTTTGGGPSSGGGILNGSVTKIDPNIPMPGGTITGPNGETINFPGDTIGELKPVFDPQDDPSRIAPDQIKPTQGKFCPKKAPPIPEEYAKYDYDPGPGWDILLPSRLVSSFLLSRL